MFSKQFVFPPIKEELCITCRQFCVDNRFSVVQWLDHVARMDETAIRKRVLKGKLYTKRRIGRSKIRWLEDVIVDLRRMGISGWMEKARNKDQWRRIVEEAKAHPGLWRREEEKSLFCRLNLIQRRELVRETSSGLHPSRCLKNCGRLYLQISST